MSISVCIATYDGEKYVAQQLRSILTQLADGDEVIVVDDCSTDGTVETIRRIGDPRIVVHVNDRNRREVFSFAKAVSLAKNDVVFLSDQDDVWLPGRVALMQQALLDSGASVVTGNFHWMNADEEALVVAYDGVAARDSRKHLKNIADIFLGKTTYFGCAMAFRREFAALILPIPSFVESHDSWIALAANLVGSNVLIDERTLRKRKHDSNATSTVSSRSLYLKVRARAILALSLIVLWARHRRTPEAAWSRYAAKTATFRML